MTEEDPSRGHRDDDEDADEDDDELREILGMSARRAPATLTIGQIIDGTYRIDAELGEGGMGRVYRAHDLKLERDVALKLHAIPLARTDDSLRREGVALAKLTHPNVVTVYGVGAWAGHPWVAMEYVSGGSARAWCAGRSPRERLALYLAAGRGLVAAHAAGIVHRDFKPDNVLVGADGRPRIADFGLASIEGVRQGHDDASSGTPGYMAPEQKLVGAIVDAAADQYAFAMTLREALGEAAPPHVVAALARASHADPRERWPAHADLLAELARDPARTRRRWIAASALGVGVVAIAFAFAWWGRATAGMTCEEARELEVTWTPARRAALPPITTRAIDAWTTRWTRERRVACESTHLADKQSPTMFDLRIACLDRAHAALAASLDVLESGDVRPASGIDVAAALPDLSECADVAVLALRPAQTTTPASLAVDDLITRATALRAAGNHPAAIAIAREAIAAAARANLPAHGALARFQLASAMYASGQRDVLGLFEEATHLAVAARDPALEVRAWIALVEFIGLRLEKPDEAARMRIVIETTLVRAGDPKRLRIRLRGLDADLALARNEYAIAIPLLEEYLRYQEVDPQPNSDLARWYNRLANALGEMERFDEATATLAKAITSIEAQFGPEHPNLGVLLTTRGGIELQRGDHARARDTFRDALAIKETTVGKDNPSLAPTLVNLALAHHELAQHAEALAAARRATTLVEGAFPAGHPRIGMALAVRANMELAAAAYGEATTTIERARAILEPLGERPPLDEVLVVIAALAQVRGELAVARTAIDRAIVISRTAHGASLETAHAIATAARLALVSGDRTRGLAELREASAMVDAALGAQHPAGVALRRELDLLVPHP